jgi:putative hydrolase of the HAD superfamily
MDPALGGFAKALSWALSTVAQTVLNIWDRVTRHASREATRVRDEIPVEISRVRRFEVVVFDLGGVVCSFRPERRLEALAEAAHCTTGEVQAAVWSSGLDGQADQGRFTRADAYGSVRTALGVEISDTELGRIWSLAFVPNREVIELVARTTTRVALLSNNGPISEDCVLEHLAEVARLFDPVLMSWRLRAVKPQPEIYRRAALRLRAVPEAILFVDDSASNVEAARIEGWHAHQYSRPPDLANELHVAGVLEP